MESYHRLPKIFFQHFLGVRTNRHVSSINTPLALSGSLSLLSLPLSTEVCSPIPKFGTWNPDISHQDSLTLDDQRGDC